MSYNFDVKLSTENLHSNSALFIVKSIFDTFHYSSFFHITFYPYILISSLSNLNFLHFSWCLFFAFSLFVLFSWFDLYLFWTWSTSSNFTLFRHTEKCFCYSNFYITFRDLIISSFSFIMFRFVSVDFWFYWFSIDFKFG